MNEYKDKERIVAVATSVVPYVQQAKLSEWAYELEVADISNLSWRKRVLQIWQVSRKSGISSETFLNMAREIRRAGWNERSPRMKVAISVFLLAAAAVGGKAGGFAAMGHAIRVGLPFVFSGLSYIATGLIEEFAPKRSDAAPKTEYTVIEAEKIDEA